MHFEEAQPPTECPLESPILKAFYGVSFIPAYLLDLASLIGVFYGWLLPVVF